MRPTTTPSTAPVPDHHRATTLELLFDVVYVFAFTQVTHLMTHGEDGQSVLRGLAVFGVLWWSWASHAWLANQHLADRGVVRVGILCAVAIVFVLSISIPEAYRTHDEPLFGPMLFACGFVLLTVVYTAVNLLVAPDPAFRRQVLLTMGVTILPVSIALVTGAVMGGTTQVVLWIAAVVIEGVTVYATSQDGEWRLPSPAHYAERHGLVVILALGESIISVGVAATESHLSASVILGCLLSILLAVALWWNYFTRLAPAAEAQIGRYAGVERAAVATIGTYLHLGIVAGILLVSLGLGEAVTNASGTEPLSPFDAGALGGGLALFLTSTTLYWWRTSGHLVATRLWAAAAAVALIPVASTAPALVAIGSAVTVAGGLAIIERCPEI